MKKFILLSLLLVIGRAYDVTTTYLYTPDLKNETNIIVKLFDAGWTSVILFQAILVGLIICLLYFYFFKFSPDIPSDKTLTQKQYVSYLFFGNTHSFNKIIYKLPKKYDVLLASTGYIASMTLISASFIVGTSTTFLLISDTYKEIYRHGVPTILYCIIVLLGIWFTLKFFKEQYWKYRSATNSSKFVA